MPRTEYTVYVSDGMVPEIEALLQQRDQSASEFFREAARRELQEHIRQEDAEA